MPLAERRQRIAVAGLRARHQDRVGQPLVDERAVGTELTTDWTGLRGRRLHGRPTLVPDAEPSARTRVVLPRLRGRFGQPYLYARRDAARHSGCSPADAPHGAVAVAEHQTEGRGRLGRVWVDEPGAGLALSVVLRPPPPVARWPELTLVAAEAVAAAIGEPARVDQAPERRPRRGRKVAGILRRRASGSCSGSASTSAARRGREPARSSATGWSCSSTILDRLERGYDAWLRPLTGPLSAAPMLPAASVALNA